MKMQSDLKDDKNSRFTRSYPLKYLITIDLESHLKSRSPPFGYF